MFRKLILASVLSLPVVALGGGHGFFTTAHAATFPFMPPQGSVDPNASCQTTYPWSGNPYTLSDCNHSDIPGGGFFSNGAGDGPFNDLSGEGIHWTGTSGSYARFLCAVPSIVSGTLYFTYSSAEIDISTSPTGLTEIFETCTVQTPDRPGANLFANFANGNECANESQSGDKFQGDFDNYFYATENATGLATLHCIYYGFDEELYYE